MQQNELAASTNGRLVLDRDDGGFLVYPVLFADTGKFTLINVTGPEVPRDGQQMWIAE